MTVSLCVINFNTIEKLNRLLTFLVTEPPDASIYTLSIADNGSTDGSEVLLKAWAESYPEIQTVFNDNIGYARACNQLAAKTDGDIIGLLNADIWFTLDDIKAVQKTFDEHPEIAILGPKQRDERGNITHGGIFGPNEAVKQRGWHVADPKDELYRDLEECSMVSGSAFFIRASVWGKLANCPTFLQSCPDAGGPFLLTPHYYEETYACYHARHHGFKVFYDGRISIGHSWHASSPIGGHADQQFQVSARLFKYACEYHGITHDIG